jgi:hypothetical protein
MSTGTLAGHALTNARLHVPAWGVPWAELVLDEEVELSGGADLVIADLQLTGTVMSGGPGPTGRSRFRWVCGTGGWGKTLPAKSYANDAGVKASSVLFDAARESGEEIEDATMPATRLGPAWAREAAPAARVLEQVVPEGWYVERDGVTRIGKRASVPLVEGALVLSTDKAFGTVTLQSETIAAILPGVTVSGLEAVDVLHTLEPSSLRTTLWAAGISQTTRRLSALRRLFKQLDPRARFRGTYEYRVVTQEGERVNLQPIRVSVGMPSLSRVFVRPGVAGARADLTLGSRVLVTFVDGDPSRPIVVGFEEADGESFLPGTLSIDASGELDLGSGAPITKIANGTLGIARQTDPVVAGPFGGTITVGSTRARCG